MDRLMGRKKEDNFCIKGLNESRKKCTKNIVPSFYPGGRCSKRNGVRSSFDFE